MLHDGHHRMTPIQAAKLGKSLEPYDLFWLEDCTPAENQAGLRLVRQHTTTPLAIGEVFNTVWDYQTLISEQLIDYVRSAVTHTGGITALRKLLDFAAMYQIKSGIHGPTDISPIGMAAALHLGLAIHNFGIQEYMRHSAQTLTVFQTSYRFEDGLLHPGDRPGLGVELDLEAAAAFPYQAAYLPVNRLRSTERCTTGEAGRLRTIAHWWSWAWPAAASPRSRPRSRGSSAASSATATASTAPTTWRKWRAARP